MTVDELLRAKEEGADEDTMTSITRRFWVHQVAKKTGGDVKVLLDLYKVVGSALRDGREEAIAKEQMEWIEWWTRKTVAPLDDTEVAAFEGARIELGGRYGLFSWQ